MHISVGIQWKNESERYLDFAGPGDGNDVWTLGEQPRKRDLPRSGPVLRADVLQSVGKLENAVEVLLRVSANP